jgi:hypothetical protein
MNGSTKYNVVAKLGSPYSGHNMTMRSNSDLLYAVVQELQLEVNLYIFLISAPYLAYSSRMQHPKLPTSMNREIHDIDKSNDGW